MTGTALQELLDETDMTPLVRATHSQAEINYLPPYGDPEVSIPGEIATYTLVSAAAIAVFEHLTE